MPFVSSLTTVDEDEVVLADRVLFGLVITEVLS